MFVITNFLQFLLLLLIVDIINAQTYSNAALISGLTEPTYVGFDDDGSGGIIIAEKAGLVKRFTSYFANGGNVCLFV